MSKTFVGARLRQLRTDRGMSQVALAQSLEISASYLNQIEHDVRPLTVPVLQRSGELNHSATGPAPKFIFLNPTNKNTSILYTFFTENIHFTFLEYRAVFLTEEPRVGL